MQVTAEVRGGPWEASVDILRDGRVISNIIGLPMSVAVDLATRINNGERLVDMQEEDDLGLRFRRLLRDLQSLAHLDPRVLSCLEEEYDHQLGVAREEGYAAGVNAPPEVNDQACLAVAAENIAAYRELVKAVGLLIKEDTRCRELLRLARTKIHTHEEVTASTMRALRREPITRPKHSMDDVARMIDDFLEGEEDPLQESILSLNDMHQHIVAEVIQNVASQLSGLFRTLCESVEAHREEEARSRC